MPAKYLIRLLLIFFILLSFVHLCYADVNEEVQKYTEAQKYYDEGKNSYKKGEYEKARQLRRTKRQSKLDRIMLMLIIGLETATKI